MFICPADWTMFQVPNGLEFTSLKNNRGEAVKSTIEKLEIMKEFREKELLSILNKQYSGMHLKEPRKVEKNSFFLFLMCILYKRVHSGQAHIKRGQCIPNKLLVEMITIVTPFGEVNLINPFPQ